MLYGMVVGCDALFLAPVEDDRTFVKLCLKGNVKSSASKYGKCIGRTIDLSDDLVDLLQKMFKVDPRERLKLKEILEHPWVTNGGIMTAEEWAKKKMALNYRASIAETNEVEQR
jgi:serine/threonine protein kinase